MAQQFSLIALTVRLFYYQTFYYFYVMDNNQLTKNFHLREFECKDGAPVPAKLMCNVIELANNLQIIRDEVKTNIHINSAYRTEEYNKNLDGASPKSQHLQAKAADIITIMHTPLQLADIINRLIKVKIIKQGGVGVYPSFVHYDTRNTEARW